MKEVIYLANLTSRDFLRHRPPQLVDRLVEYLHRIQDGSCLLTISLPFEEKLFELDRSGELSEYHELHPHHRSALPNLIQECYRTLNVVHYYTCSNEEVRCWCMRLGKNIQDAASLKDINISRKLIRGEVIAFEDFERYSGDRVKLMMEVKIKSETRKYIINDGDLIQFVHHPL